MQRDTSVLLMTVVESADAIADAVEREFITIGEVLNNLSRIDSGLFACIQQAPRIRRADPWLLGDDGLQILQQHKQVQRITR
jgi:hypothetical protein